MRPPQTGDTWVALGAEPLPVGTAADWVVRPHCGALVLFSGTARDHSEGREDVTELEYEAYEEQVEPRLAAIVEEMRARWPDVGRVAMLHKVGPVAIGESSVVVAVSAPHRGAAFEAARYGIDALKATAPIWKRERWGGGDEWALEAQHVTAPEEVR
jgi:molybdopterin synthase catalytic subunit